VRVLSLKKFKNPFYTLLIPVGLVFVITVFVYVLMASTELSGTKREVRDQANQPLFTWLNEHGTKLVLWELGVLGVLTIGAIATDSWWMSDSCNHAPDLQQDHLGARPSKPKIMKIDVLRQLLLVMGSISMMSGFIVYSSRNSDGVTINSSAPLWMMSIGAVLIAAFLVLRKYRTKELGAEEVKS
jgi:hypothetical protein